MDTLPPDVSKPLMRFLVGFVALLLGAIVSVVWWRLTHLVLEIRDIDRRLTRVETQLAIKPSKEKISWTSNPEVTSKDANTE